MRDRAFTKFLSCSSFQLAARAGGKCTSDVNFLSVIYGAAMIEVSGFMTRPADSNYSPNTNATENFPLIDLVINASTQVRRH